MPEREIPITLVVRELDDDVVVATPLLFDEVACCQDSAQGALAAARELAKRAAEASANFILHQRCLLGEVTLHTVEITLPPPTKSEFWSEPVELKFAMVRWRHGTDAYLAMVPELGIEIMAAREPDLNRMIPEHIVAALRRNKTAESLYELALVQRSTKVTLERSSISANIKTPRSIEQDEGKEKEPKPAIEEVGTVLDAGPLSPAYAMEAIVEQMADALGGRHPRSVLPVAT